MGSTSDFMSPPARVLTLTSTTPVVCPMQGNPLPLTVYLTSADAGRLIEYSVDNGVKYYTASYDASSATQLVVKVQGSITHLRFTGAANDTYGWL